MPSLFDPYDLGPIRLKNRIVMAPMERSRARNLDWVPEAETARYFSQRAGAGLIVTGSIAISEWARTWAFEPGLYTAAQIEGWQRVTREVHDHGGVIFGHSGMVAARAMSRISRIARLQSALPAQGQRKRSPWPSMRMVGQHSWCKANLARCGQRRCPASLPSSEWRHAMHV